VHSEEKLKDVEARGKYSSRKSSDPFHRIPDFKVSVSKFKFAVSEEKFKCDFTELQEMHE
jgi:hypothetical protein